VLLNIDPVIYDAVVAYEAVPENCDVVDPVQLLVTKFPVVPPFRAYDAVVAYDAVPENCDVVDPVQLLVTKLPTVPPPFKA